MSLLISGLNLPNDKPVTLFITSNRHVYLEGVLLSGKAVPIPVHGRLIDADALEAKGYCLSKLHIDYDAPRGSKVWRECVPFDEAPTIIPAEEEAQ